MFPVNHVQICWWMIGGTCIVHPSAVMRRECIVEYGSYDDEYIYAQDYELWTRWIRLGARLANVPETLLKYRISADQISTKYFEPQSKTAIEIAAVYINFLLSENLQSKEIVGVRQLFGWRSMDANAVCGIPILLRLMRLRRFRPWIYYAWSTRSTLAANIAKAIDQYGGSERKQALAALLVVPLVSPRVVIERSWWAGLIKYFGSRLLS